MKYRSITNFIPTLSQVNRISRNINAKLNKFSSQISTEESTMAKIFHPRNPSLQREIETNRRIMVKKNRDTWKDVEENLMLDGRGWNFPYFIGANAVESPLNLHVETGPSVMRITKPVALDAGVGSAIPEVCQLIYTGLVQTRTAARSPITLFGCETRARFVARLFTFEQRNDRARLLNRIDDGEGNGSIVPTAFVRSLL